MRPIATDARELAEEFPDQQQEPPGSTNDMGPRPDHGEHSCRGSGKLTGGKALITGGNSRIGRAVAIAFVREGADVALTQMPEARDDAQATRVLVEAANQKVRMSS